jgi:hypothetical protein
MSTAEGLTQPEVGQSDVDPATVSFGEDLVSLTAPVPPGAKQIAVTWLLPRRRRLAIPIDQPMLRLELLVEDSTATVQGLAVAEPIDLDGRSFRRFGSDSVVAGRSLVIDFGSSRGATSRALIPIVVGLGVVALVLGLRFALRGKPGGEAAAPAAPAGQDALLAQIVALDERYEGRQGEVDAEEWASYQKRRARLKAQLEQMV